MEVFPGNVLGTCSPAARTLCAMGSEQENMAGTAGDQGLWKGQWWGSVCWPGGRVGPGGKGLVSGVRRGGAATVGRGGPRGGKRAG